MPNNPIANKIDEINASHTSNLEIQAALCYHKKTTIRELLAQNLNLSLEHQVKLSKDKIYWVRRALVFNKNISSSILSKLFLELQKEIVKEYKIGFKYNNPETQALLEKFLLLL